VPAVCTVIGNMTKPTSERPALMRFREVETFFHEFGHVMHCVCSKPKYSVFAWAWSAVPWPGGVEQDFLEVPSMMLENWMYEPSVLQVRTSLLLCVLLGLRRAPHRAAERTHQLNLCSSPDGADTHTHTRSLP
jgi:hypothetical protein